MAVVTNDAVPATTTTTAPVGLTTTFPPPSLKTTTTSNSSCSPPATPPKQQQVMLSSAVASPCAACKILRRRCAENCVLAPYFPPTEPLKFTTAHRVFGASNIIKFLQELPESQRADAVSSMVYEANARIRDPVYGCAGAICQLQKQVNDLQAQLAKAKAQVLNVQFQLQAQLMTRFFANHQSPTAGEGGCFPPSLSPASSSSPSSSTLSPPDQDLVGIIDGYFPSCYLDDGAMQTFGWEAADMILG